MAAATWTRIGDRSVKAVAAATADAPSASTDGISLDGVAALGLVLSADSTRTLSATGWLRCYGYQASVARWARCKALDIDLTQEGVSGVRDNAFAALEVPAGIGRVAWIPDTVGVSAGGVTLYINAASKTGRAL